MNKEIKSKWVEALRSGKYEQAKGMLRTQNGKFCCYGVLCEITGVPHSDGGYRFSDAGICETMPCGSLRVDIESGGMDASVLSTMNDEGKSFLQIADFIEINL